MFDRARSREKEREFLFFISHFSALHKALRVKPICPVLIFVPSLKEMEGKHYRSPLAIAGFILLFAGIVVAGLIWLLNAQPTKSFYSLLGFGLGFLAINPFILRTGNSKLWQGLIIGAAAASVWWIFFA